MNIKSLHYNRLEKCVSLLQLETSPRSTVVFTFFFFVKKSGYLRFTTLTSFPTIDIVLHEFETLSKNFLV